MSTERARRVMGTPIVLERAKKGDGKKKRKARLKDADRAERAMYKAAKRTVDATDRGIRRYDKARRRSARKQRDGALVDIMPNTARGMVTAATRMAPVPLDVMRAGYSPSTRRLTRRSVKAASKMLRGR